MQGRLDDLRTVMVRVAERDVEAFALLYRRLAGETHRRALGITRDADLADDVVQEVFAELWRRSDHYDPTLGSVRSWVQMLTRGRAIDCVRREATWRRRHQDSERSSAGGLVEPTRDDVVESVIAAQQSRHLHEVMTVLTERERSAIALAYFAGSSYAQVADQLGISLPALKSRIRSGLARMRAELEPTDLDDDRRDTGS